MSVEEIKAWLRDVGQDRVWLGSHCGVSKRTVDNWFSAGEFPSRALVVIDRLRADSLRPKMVMNESQWDLIESARKIAGYENRQDFYRDVLTEYAKTLLGKEASKEAPKDQPGGE